MDGKTLLIKIKLGRGIELSFRNKCLYFHIKFLQTRIQIRFRVLGVIEARKHPPRDNTLGGRAERSQGEHGVGH